MASGGFSREILRRTDFAQVFSIDMWASDRGHTDEQRAVARAATVGDPDFAGRSCVLWSTFKDVKAAFPRWGRACCGGSRGLREG